MNFEQRYQQLLEKVAAAAAPAPVVEKQASAPAPKPKPVEKSAGLDMEAFNLGFHQQIQKGL
jgi:hypothetical protein